jgi:hypothetical protein
MGKANAQCNQEETPKTEERAKAHFQIINEMHARAHTKIATNEAAYSYTENIEVEP